MKDKRGQTQTPLSGVPSADIDVRGAGPSGRPTYDLFDKPDGVAEEPNAASSDCEDWPILGPQW